MRIFWRLTSPSTRRSTPFWLHLNYSHNYQFFYLLIYPIILVLGNLEGIVTEDNESAWKCVCTLSGFHGRTIYDVSWCHLTGLIATACGDDAIRIFKEDEHSDPNEPNFSLIYTVDRAHTQDVNCVNWNPVVSGMLASCSDDGEIKVWSLKE